MITNILTVVMFASFSSGLWNSGYLFGGFQRNASIKSKSFTNKLMKRKIAFFIGDRFLNVNIFSVFSMWLIHLKWFTSRVINGGNGFYCFLVVLGYWLLAAALESVDSIDEVV